jgi:regulator of sigma E protease
MIQSVLSVVLVLGGLIFFHELGHFLVARFLGMGVKTFSLGFGPKLWSLTRNRVEYRLSAVPLGGYVNLVGESPDAELPEGFTEAESFSLRAPWQRILVVAAGPVANFVLAFLIYFALFLAQGRTEVLPVVGELTDPGPAKSAGMLPGDEVAAVDGAAVHTWTDLVAVVSASEGKTLTFTVRRGDGKLDIPVTPQVRTRKNLFGEEIRVPMIGVVAAGKTVTVDLGGGSAAVEAARQTWAVVSLTVQGIVKLIERVIPADTVGGPIMIARMVSEQAKAGLTAILSLAALLSVNLGLMNLLPVPVLDGGHIVFFSLEAITRRPPSDRVRAGATRVGLAFILLLMGLATYNDLTGLFK